MKLAADDPRHGTVNGYNNHGCRCAACRKASSDAQRARFSKPCITGCGRNAYVSRPTNSGRCRACEAECRRTAEHGTEARYSRGCRCEECRVAANAARRRRRHADLEATRAYDRSRMPIRVKRQRERRRRIREQVAA